MSYSVKVWPSYTTGVEVTTGTVVTSSARVFYDDDAPRDTNVHTATMDVTAPTVEFAVSPLGGSSYRITFDAWDR